MERRHHDEVACRAATAVDAPRQAGYRDVAVFVGAWHEWAARH
ncbi:hypothetical protein [Inquilinus limosus]|nr:hypothetical protein [Inquilinus limosus]